MFGNVTNRIFAGRIETPHQRMGFFDYLITLDRSFRERRHLASMSDDQLKDVGLSRQNVETELGARTWEPPVQMR